MVGGGRSGEHEPLPALHHVQVSCPMHGEAAVRGFYGALLGLVEVEKPPVLAARGSGTRTSLGTGASTPPTRTATGSRSSARPTRPIPTRVA